MSKITSSKKIAIEDFKDQKDWISKLLNPVNTLTQDLISILNGGAILDDNIMSQSYSITLSNDGTRTTASFSWQWDKKIAPSMVVISQLQEVGSTYVPAVGWSWIITGKTITCYISNLSASKDYILKIRGIV